MSFDLLTPDEAIAFLGLDRIGLKNPRESLRWLQRTGKVRFTRIGRHVRFRKVWLEELIESNAIRPRDATPKKPQLPWGA